ncbi:hypothetical protein L2E82_34264 [Cichorium intybus]|uniref:Uncharacterized protein n=1 Tax=Cichorium intybus TaxID=13427 RepID=A0ACB9BLU6_CICIN|nr:hypothetical protein L2E82_34264 [Cichorium intybus]
MEKVYVAIGHDVYKKVLQLSNGHYENGRLLKSPLLSFLQISTGTTFTHTHGFLIKDGKLPPSYVNDESVDLLYTYQQGKLNKILQQYIDFCENRDVEYCEIRSTDSQTNPATHIRSSNMQASDGSYVLKVILMEIWKFNYGINENSAKETRFLFKGWIGKMYPKNPKNPRDSPSSSSSADSPSIWERSAEEIEEYFKQLLESNEEIWSGTEQFSEKFRIKCSGDFTNVYKARINQTTVAVKLYEVSEEEFCSKVKILSGVQHPHLVAMLGFCTELKCIVFDRSLLRVDFPPSIQTETYPSRQSEPNQYSFGPEQRFLETTNEAAVIEAFDQRVGELPLEVAMELPGIAVRCSGGYTGMTMAMKEMEGVMKKADDVAVHVGCLGNEFSADMITTSWFPHLRSLVITIILFPDGGGKDGGSGRFKENGSRKATEDVMRDPHVASDGSSYEFSAYKGG